MNDDNMKDTYKYLSSLVHFYTKIKTIFATKEELAEKSPIESPTFTGTPTAPTAETNTNNDQIATTEYVTTALSNLAKVENGNLILNIRQAS